MLKNIFLVQYKKISSLHNGMITEHKNTKTRPGT